ncbi:hypothetical protein AC481_00400 [miscellaneous Crenarchaeota group archaeon SMTZ-80]|jgi:tetraacyldisaccharide 4'-kinase|nr:MAG: hypothetical protein AC481_00400 [miscellaneous Crenarchaeota group archaeon SMTZ-80]
MALPLSIIGIFLWLLLLFYTLLVFLRMKLYDWGWFKTCNIESLVISVGNIQLGGTGKTPFVDFLARELLKAGYQPIVLTRGYLRKNTEPVFIMGNEEGHRLQPSDIGDEPFLLGQNLPDVPIGIDPNRCRMARQLLKKYPDGILILDDGFQHRRIPRQLDIVLIDVSRWSEFPFLFPITYFRDIKRSLLRADIIILTRTEYSLNKTNRVYQYVISKYTTTVFKCNTIPVSLIDLANGHEIELKHIKGKSVAVFAGIGNFEQFFYTVKNLGCSICWFRKFSDHYFYRESDLEEINEIARNRNAEMLITTQKDAVKLRNFIQNFDSNIYFLKIHIRLDNEKKFWKMVNEYIIK